MLRSLCVMCLSYAINATHLVRFSAWPNSLILGAEAQAQARPAQLSLSSPPIPIPLSSMLKRPKLDLQTFQPLSNLQNMTVMPRHALSTLFTIRSKPHRENRLPARSSSGSNSSRLSHAVRVADGVAAPPTAREARRRGRRHGDIVHRAHPRRPGRGYGRRKRRAARRVTHIKPAHQPLGQESGRVGAVDVFADGRRQAAVAVAQVGLAATARGEGLVLVRADGHGERGGGHARGGGQERGRGDGLLRGAG